MVTKAIRFDEQKWAALSEVAKERGTTTSSLIREVMYEFLKSQKGAGKK